jgi:adenine-specific DNA-methyltransferase
MAIINNLIDRVTDPKLRQQLLDEVDRMKKQTKFGLVFEEHLPEAIPLYEVPVVKGCLVATRDKSFTCYYLVEKIDGDKLLCEKQDESHEKVVFKKDEVVRVALFGQPIYPYLQHMDEVKNAPNSNLWHTLIEAENYHALQLLVYLYGGKVDCIYIDPPYNTGAKDWKYNNDYVDSNDSYRHSKWLSMMKKRLILAKKLLNPQNSILIVTIDEKEYLRLGCLLEELFPEAKIQMISTCINPGGASRGTFRRVDEYIFYIMIGDALPIAMLLESEWFGGDLSKHVLSLNWRSFSRAGSNSNRSDRPNLFYPIFISNDLSTVVSIGESYYGNDKSEVCAPEGSFAVWPSHQDGSDSYWMYNQSGLRSIISKGYFHIGNRTKNGAALYYLNKGEQLKISKGIFKIIGRNPKDGSVITETVNDTQNAIAPTQWRIPSHNARTGGTEILKKIIGNRFEFPKSVYAVHDTIRFFVANKPNALIVDFFAGSGTTLHAVNLLNAEDGGKRCCIMVTNNEVSVDEETRLKAAGYHPGQEEWDKWGIARYVNWPRTKCSILGQDVNGEPLTGSYQTCLKQEKERKRAIKQITLIDNPSLLTTAQKKELVALCCQGKLPQSLVKADSKYIVSEEHTHSILFDIDYAKDWFEELNGQDQVTDLFVVTKSNNAFKQLKTDIQELLGNIIEEEPVLLPMSEGFTSNVKYFKLGFLDKHSVALHRQFRELLPLLWMKAGCIGECPVLSGKDIPDILVLDSNRMAILTNEDEYSDFRNRMENRQDIDNIFIIAKSEHAFLEMAQPFTWAKTYHLYKDYLDNFSINYER